MLLLCNCLTKATVMILIRDVNCYLFLFFKDTPRDYCLDESLNISCRHSSLILITSAMYGRMRLGRCIAGDFNLGCSVNLIAYFDSQCTARPVCDVSIRNLVDIHPCQKDYISYLEVSYKCIESEPAIILCFYFL